MKALKLCGFGVLVAILIFTVPAFAEQMWVHGTEGRIQDMSLVTGYGSGGNVMVFGWGLQFIQNPGNYNWIHYAVPTKYGPSPGSWGARYIYINLRTFSNDIGIYQVDIWNGTGGQIKTITYNPPITGWQLPMTIDLGAVTSFYGGLGLSIKIGAGVESMDHTIAFFGVGANFSSGATTIAAADLLLLSD